MFNFEDQVLRADPVCIRFRIEISFDMEFGFRAPVLSSIIKEYKVVNYSFDGKIELTHAHPPHALTALSSYICMEWIFHSAGYLMVRLVFGVQFFPLTTYTSAGHPLCSIQFVSQFFLYTGARCSNNHSMHCKLLHTAYYTILFREKHTIPYCCHHA